MPAPLVEPAVALEERAMRLDQSLERASRVIDRVYREAVNARAEDTGSSASV